MAVLDFGIPMMVCREDTAYCLYMSTQGACVIVCHICPSMLLPMSPGHEIRRITAGGNEICIWSVLMLSNREVVSGDSSGRLAIWDAQFGTIVGSFHQHAADVTTVVSSPDGSMLFASGVDSQIAAYRCIPSANGARYPFCMNFQCLFCIH